MPFLTIQASFPRPSILISSGYHEPNGEEVVAPTTKYGRYVGADFQD
jgi:hypothetical protein